METTLGQESSYIRGLDEMKFACDWFADAVIRTFHIRNLRCSGFGCGPCGVSGAFRQGSFTQWHPGHFVSRLPHSTLLGPRVRQTHPASASTSKRKQIDDDAKY